MLPLTPTKLGRYEIVDEIGKGAMGVVYLARDPLIGRLVALKTFRIGYSVRDADLDQFRARFIREAQSAGILSHPNIVTIHDVVERSDEGLAFIAMEYVRGTNLKTVLQEDRRPPLPYVTGIVAQVAAALDYAHSCKVIHRDIKPANILITADDRVKITDFGIARLDTSNLTQEGQLLGTPNYMSPEQILGREIDSRADIFSLGVVLYEMLTRHKPFQGENLTVVSHRIVYDHFTPPREYVDDLPPGTEAILNKTLEKDPARRYQRAHDLADDLRRVLGEVSPRDQLNETQSLSATAVLPAERLAGLHDAAGPTGAPPITPAAGAAGAAGAPGKAAGLRPPPAAVAGAASASSTRATRPAFFKRLIRGAGRAAAADGAAAGAAGAPQAGAAAYPHATRPTPLPTPTPRALTAVPAVPVPAGAPAPAGAAAVPLVPAPAPPADPAQATREGILALPAAGAASAASQVSAATGAAPGSYPAAVPPATAAAVAPEVPGIAAAFPAQPAGAVQPAAVGRPAGGGVRRGLFSTSLRRASLLGAAALVLATAAGWGLVSWARRQAPRERVVVDHVADANRSEVISLVKDARRLLDSGDPRGAAVAYRRAEQLAPEQAASLRKRRGEAERQAQEQDRRLEVEHSIAAKLTEARAELAGRRYAEADAAASAVLAMSPGNTAATEVRSAALAAQHRKEKLAAASQAGNQPAPLRDNAAAAGQQAAAVRPAGPPAPAAEAAGEATLELAFFSELPEGVVMLYVNDQPVFRQSFDFREKGGLGGLFRMKSRSDWVRRSFQIAAGSAKIRLYVTPQGRAAQVQLLAGNFASGATRRLDAKLAGSGELTCSLAPPP